MFEYICEIERKITNSSSSYGRRNEGKEKERVCVCVCLCESIERERERRRKGLFQEQHQFGWCVQDREEKSST